MGGILSKRKHDPNDYEKILSDLDEKIQKIEIKLSDIKLRQRRTGLWFALIGAFVWVVYGVYYLLIFRNEPHPMETTAVMSIMIFALPVLVYYIRQLLMWLYTRRQKTLESSLKTLRGEQKLKVEELKKKTSYYTTQSLLDRYDSAAAKKKKDTMPSQQQRSPQQLQQPQRAQQQITPLQGPGPFPNQQLHQRRPIGPGEQETYPAGPPQPPKWYDKIVDALVGEDGPETKFALICNHCCSHNGLVLPSEVDTIQYVCPHCKKFNPSRKARPLHPDGPVILPGSPFLESRQSTPQPPPSPKPLMLEEEVEVEKAEGDNEAPKRNESSCDDEHEDRHDKDSDDDTDEKLQASEESGLNKGTSVAQRVVKRRNKKN